MAANEKRTKSMRIANMHIPSHGLMLFWSIIALFPFYMLIVNSFKSGLQIYANPFGLPTEWTLANYEYIIEASNFFMYFGNSFLVVSVSLFFILLLGSLAAYALAHWRSTVSTAIYFFFIIGMMLPIKIATIRLMEIIKSLGLMNTLWSLFPIYIAMGLPFAVFILTEFIRGLPIDLYEAAYIDGAKRSKIYYSIVLPLIKPALATVAIYNLVPIWNDLWFPLIFITADNQKTVLLAVTKLQGQYATDWPRVFALLTLSALPVITLYLLFSRNFVAGLTAGAIKG
ncbi:MAG: carbohydrate ABC transporter permease [Eubacteriales bacterium]|jgi:raffinose/stachyose/melibiose transport system permease protein|nr:carbohydrate ABC transporter permease [Eubacteriales bacterium]MDD4106260.1 carbohydrate ABC transporter permease [Eubacteriales bacterium]MDD4711658.1 carbohydrate ABC transporter permease [Eubacteriales bacterium]NLO15567.1 carbohydrate ABC transporter permease [Clostridiales bacterium]